MRDKGVITEAEYESAMADLANTLGARASEANNLVLGKWSTTLYGFVEGDAIYDTTESFIDDAGNSLVARPGTYAGDNGRMQFGARNTRFGFRFRAPESHAIRASALIEADFFQPPAATGGLTVNPNTNTTSNAYGSEQNFWVNAVVRIRHAYVKLETPVVDFLAGQYWHLFGWQPLYQPGTVQIQGLQGELFERTPQFRVSKTIGANDPVSLEIAVAALRPPQRDSATPEGTAAMRVAINGVKGMYTSGQTNTALAPLSVGISGDLRHIAVNAWSATPKGSNDKIGTAIAANALVPILPATPTHKGNTLTALGQAEYGYGISDLFTFFNGGVGFPPLPQPPPPAAPVIYTPNIDPGIATYDTNGNLHYIQWKGLLVGLQYYLPGLDGRVFVSANYSHLESPNTGDYFTGKTAAGVLSDQDWFDGLVMADVTDAVRVGLEYANTNDRYLDGTHAINHRGQGSIFFLF